MRGKVLTCSILTLPKRLIKLTMGKVGCGRSGREVVGVADGLAGGKIPTGGGEWRDV